MSLDCERRILRLGVRFRVGQPAARHLDFILAEAPMPDRRPRGIGPPAG
jgi:hypothetical protein